MGLDWHSVVPATKEYKEDYVRRYYGAELAEGKSLADLLKEHAPTTMKPCIKVGAKKMKDVENFMEIAKEALDTMKALAMQEKAKENANVRFIEHWENMTLEKLMEQDGDKWYCDGCPLLKALNGADSTGSFFVGVTVNSCDFRGKRISADDALSSELREEAYEPHGLLEMQEFIDAMEDELEFQRGIGNLEKESYKDYSVEFDRDKWHKLTGEKKLTKEEYSKTLHWREENLREAIRWVKICMDMDVEMETSY